LQSRNCCADRRPDLPGVMSQARERVTETVALQATWLGCEELREQAASQVPFGEK